VKPVSALQAAAAVLALAISAGQAAAQRVVQDPVAVAAVGLFQNSCMPFAGHPRDLRGWVAAHHLPALSPGATQALLRGEPGKAFWASTPDGKMVLVSNDNGSCSVVLPAADKATVDTALQDYFGSLGTTAAQMDDKTSPDGKAHQTLWMVSLRNRSWLVSTTSHAPDDGSNVKPMLIMVATDHQRGGPHP
jgi:hypothetical protein